MHTERLERLETGADAHQHGKPLQTTFSLSHLKVALPEYDLNTVHAQSNMRSQAKAVRGTCTHSDADADAWAGMESETLESESISFEMFVCVHQRTCISEAAAAAAAAHLFPRHKQVQARGNRCC